MRISFPLSFEKGALRVSNKRKFYMPITITSLRARAAASSQVEPWAYPPKATARLLGCGLTHVFDLLNTGQLESYWDGGRKITAESIKAHIARCRAATEQNKPRKRGRPKKNQST